MYSFIFAISCNEFTSDFKYHNPATYSLTIHSRLIHIYLQWLCKPVMMYIDSYELAFLCCE